MIRFDRARRRLQRRAAAGRPPDLAALAAGCGYYDQAHLDRRVPRRWRAARRPPGWPGSSEIVQAAAGCPRQADDHER